MIGRWGFLILLGGILFSSSGCIIGVYSIQDFRPGLQIYSVARNSTLADVIKVAGSPDKIFKDGETTILVYTQYEGRQILGLFGDFRKKEFVIILEGGLVTQGPILVERGEAMTILGVLSTPISGPAIVKQE